MLAGFGRYRIKNPFLCLMVSKSVLWFQWVWLQCMGFPIQCIMRRTVMRSNILRVGWALVYSCQHHICHKFPLVGDFPPGIPNRSNTDAHWLHCLTISESLRKLLCSSLWLFVLYLWTVRFDWLLTVCGVSRLVAFA